VRGIVDTAREEQVDLIVMATHARSPLSELASGSVADDIVRTGIAPVTLVRWREDVEDRT
jgi:nucleotide-binding universal stress UspA family protein